MKVSLFNWVGLLLRITLVLVPVQFSVGISGNFYMEMGCFVAIRQQFVATLHRFFGRDGNFSSHL
ncbi:hypothetical protein G7048_07775 [Diaphorobacter sp. HDW4B]|uniref:hypothetical protein n=1 Tax=Diaphorobacter sp. HDW4B TaxID=2714925 RepID=UPI00140CCD9E|nr:hypothetical protein [Diaphorobacter sp. HDW4B]QIL70262.1 hypothetical protein G7048_07775 [Diaphorobacter sp. HDW4B]